MKPEDDVDPGEIRIRTSTEEVLRFCPDGRVYVKGELVDSNQVVYAAILANFVTTPTELHQKYLLSSRAWHEAKLAMRRLKESACDMADYYDQLDKDPVHLGQLVLLKTLGDRARAWKKWWHIS